MNDNERTIRHISWRDICPWLIIFRTFSIAVGVRVLLLSLTAVVAVSAGWRIAARACFDVKTEAPSGRFVLVELPGEAAEDRSPINAIEREARKISLEQAINNYALWPGHYAGSGYQEVSPGMPPSMQVGAWSPFEPFYNLWRSLSEPFRRWFDANLSNSELGFYVSGGLWSLLVWALFGGAITRIATLKLTREEQSGLTEAFTFAQSRWLSYFGAPLVPVFGIVLAAIPMVILGWLMLFDIGVVVAGLLWFVLLLLALIMAILSLGLLFGWPLMWSAISTEGSDAFDALSRCYSYTFQRPLQYLFYAFVATIFGALSWIVVLFVTEGVVSFAHWGAAWGAGVNRAGEVALNDALDPAGGAGADTATVAAAGETEAPSGTFKNGARIIAFWDAVARAVATAFSYAFFWTSATAIYLLLRQDLDQVELDEVFIEDDNFELPSVKVSKPQEASGTTPANETKESDETASTASEESDQNADEPADPSDPNNRAS